jgi:uncharacterized membrane protein YqiK
MLPTVAIISGIVVAILFGVILFAKPIVGLVIISENQVGVVIKKFGDPLPHGAHVATKGEAGYQADTLAPGWHFGYFFWQSTVRHVSVTKIPAGEIGLVIAADGKAIPPSRILAKEVVCENFQDAKLFLQNGGEKGRQLSILTGGTYRINTALFTIITSQNATEHNLQPHQLQIYQVAPSRVGIVTTLDGEPIDEGEIAGNIIHAEHNNFQNAQRFLDGGGRRGLQEQVLLSGSWNINPWFARVEQVPMTEIPIGHVGIVISFVGKEHVDVSGDAFKHGNLVDPGHKGVWVTPLYPGKHPLNSQVMKVELVPTTNIVLNWASRTESHNLDRSLSPITVRSKDGFAFNLDVSQIIHIGAPEAPKVISRVGAVQNLVDHVLQPIVGNYFRNSAQEYTVLDFLTDRSQRQEEAAQHIRKAISLYDVQALDTLIGDITPPQELMTTQTDRKIAEEQRKTYEVQREAQMQRQLLVRETSMANIQQEMVKSEQGVTIADLQSKARIKQAEGEAQATRLQALGEAESVRAIGEARAKSYQAGVAALGQQGYTAIQLMQVVGQDKVRIVPDVLVNGGGGGDNSVGIADSLLALVVHNQLKGEVEG